MIGKTKAKEPVSASDALLAVQKQIVDQVGVLLDLRAAEEAARAAVLAENGHPVGLPDLGAYGLWQSLQAQQRVWAARRRDLVAPNEPPPPSKAEVWVTECRAAVANAEKMLAKYQGMLDEATGPTARRELQGVAYSWAEALQQARARLSEALQARGNLTAAERREVMALTEARNEPVRVSVAF